MYSTKAEVRALHFAIIFFQTITKSTRKLTKSTDQRRIYDVNRISTSKNKKVSENFESEILSTEILSTEFSEIFLFKKLILGIFKLLSKLTRKFRGYERTSTYKVHGDSRSPKESNVIRFNIRTKIGDYELPR